MSGYKLRIILENMDIPRHKVTNSAIYPVLKQLEQQGDIVLRETDSARDEKMAHLLPQGMAHLKRLLRQPVSRNTKTESIYRCKIRSLPAVEPALQRQILLEYRQFVQEDLDHYHIGEAHVSQEQAKAPDNAYLGWGIRNIHLNQQLSQTKLDWIDTQLKEITDEKK